MSYDTEKLNNIPIGEVAEALKLDLSRKKMIMCFKGHDTKTPSLSFNLKENYFNCFGCEIAGGPINLVIDYYECTFLEACQWLDEHFFNASSKKISLYTPSYRQMNNMEETFHPDPEVYSWVIDNSSLSDTVINYFSSERAIDEETIKSFNIKDIQNPQQFFKQAKTKWGIERLVKCGLWVNDNGRNRATWWEHVIVFPFYDSNGNITYLQGRYINNQNDIRWMNLAGVRSTIFNEIILQDIKQGDRLVITEGLTDAISLVQLGVNAVGIMGASNFKSSYVQKLKNYDLYIAADNDNGGNKFFERIQDAFRQEKTVKRIEFPVEFNDVNDALVGGYFE